MTRYPAPAVTVVIPTIGRDSLQRAIASALAQTFPVHEVMVCNDGFEEVRIPDDPRVHVVDSGPGLGGNTARQQGIQQAGGTWIALLDDDDEWDPVFLERVVAEVADRGLREEPTWIASAHMRTPNGQIYPRRAIEDDEDLVDYLFLFNKDPLAYGWLPTSTLVFPRALGLEVPWRPEQRFHQDPTWLLDVYRTHPHVPVVQLPAALVQGYYSESSVSKTIAPAQSAQWAREHILGSDSPRRRPAFANFLLSRTPMRAAARAGRLRLCVSIAWAAIRDGRLTPAGTVHLLMGLALATKRAMSRRG